MFGKAIDLCVTWTAASLVPCYVPDYKPVQGCFVRIKTEQALHLCIRVSYLYIWHPTHCGRNNNLKDQCVGLVAASGEAADCNQLNTPPLYYSRPQRIGESLELLWSQCLVCLFWAIVEKHGDATWRAQWQRSWSLCRYEWFSLSHFKRWKFKKKNQLLLYFCIWSTWYIHFPRNGWVQTEQLFG